MEGKHPANSKTLWANGIAMLIAVVTAVLGSDLVSPAYVALGTGILLPILNVILRFITKEPLSFEADIKKLGGGGKG